MTDVVAMGLVSLGWCRILAPASGCGRARRETRYEVQAVRLSGCRNWSDRVSIRFCFSQYWQMRPFSDQTYQTMGSFQLDRHTASRHPTTHAARLYPNHAVSHGDHLVLAVGYDYESHAPPQLT